MHDSGFRIQDTGYRIHDSGYRMLSVVNHLQDSVLRIHDAELLNRAGSFII
jgi:hypothetical protein